MIESAQVERARHRAVAIHYVELLDGQLRQQFVEAAFQMQDIYQGSIAFVCVELFVVATILFRPEIVLMGLGEQKVLDVENVDLSITPMEEPMDEEPPPSFGPTPSTPPPAPSTP